MWSEDHLQHSHLGAALQCRFLGAAPDSGPILGQRGPKYVHCTKPFMGFSCPCERENRAEGGLSSTQMLRVAFPNPDLQTKPQL